MLIICFVTGIGLRANIEQRLVEANVSQKGLAERISSYLVSSRADKTAIKYKSTLNRFQRFCCERGYIYLPANPIHVTVYLSDLLDQRVSYGVIAAAFYAIKWVHNINNYQDPTENGFVKSLLDAAKRLRSNPVKRKDVINSKLLIQLCDQYIGSAKLTDIRDLAMILIGYAGLLRFDEISNIRSNDISFKENHLEIIIRRRKTDKFRAGNKVFISKGNTLACAYGMLKCYIDISGVDIKSDTYLFKPIFKSKGQCKLIYKDKPISYTRTRRVRKQPIIALYFEFYNHEAWIRQRVRLKESFAQNAISTKISCTGLHCSIKQFSHQTKGNIRTSFLFFKNTVKILKFS